MNKIEKKVLEKITPTNEYKNRIKRITHELEKKLEIELKKRHLPVTIELVGSIAKDTYLKNDLDIDIFIKFPIRFQKEEIGKSAISIGKEILSNTEESYAEHPYIRGYFKKVKVEIVPCYEIEKSSQKLSAVDRTPLHTKYIKKHLPDSQKPQVRLFKQFLKGIGCYGAEAEIEGFSGYLSELLILKYSSFKKLVEDAQKWESGKTITLTKDDIPSFGTPLVFIDPVDINRNVSSAVSKEKFDLFIKACREYLKKPSINFFFQKKIKPWPLKKIRDIVQKQNFQYISIKFAKPNIIPENLYPQIRKAVKSITDICKKNDFFIFDTKFFVDNEIYIIIKTKIEPLSKTIEHAGPPIELKENIDDFIKKWESDPRVIKKPYEKNGRLFVELTRDYTNIDDFLNENIKYLSLGKHIDPVIKRKYKILKTRDLINEDLRVFWTEYLDSKMSWER